MFEGLIRAQRVPVGLQRRTRESGKEWVRRVLVAAVLCVPMAAPLPSEAVQVRAVFAGLGERTSSPHPVKVEIVGGVTGQHKRSLTLDGAEAFEFEPEEAGAWYLTPRATGFWGETVVLVVPSTSEDLQLKLWPAAYLHARLAEKLVVRSVQVRFQPSNPGDGSTEIDQLPRAASDCEVEGLNVECTIPAGTLDYSLRTEGYAPSYHWNQVVVAGDDVDLGRLEFKEGATLLGRVEGPAGVNIPEGSRVRVSLIPQLPRLQHSPERTRSEIADSSVLADERGRFVFEGATPGAYLIVAATTGMISEQREVTLTQGLEADLREPLVLSPPITLGVRVEPATDPWGEPWVAELSRFDSRHSEMKLVRRSPVGPDGRWQGENLTPGEYIIEVRRSQGVWHSEFVSMRESSEIDVRISLTRVRGELKLGEVPVEGSLWFGGQYGEVSVPTRTDSEGRFKAILPAVDGDTWRDVDVASDEPPVRTSLRDVHLSGPDDEGIFSVEIVLPSNRLYGKVTNQRGAPAQSNATVFASMAGSESQPLQAEVDEGGLFAMYGLPAGSYSIGARGADGESESTTVAINDESDAYVELVLERAGAIEGTVLSPSGPVAGAMISLYPEDRSGFGLLPRDRTGMDGSFRVELPSNPRGMTMTVAAPGYAYRFFGIPVPPNEAITVAVEQNGGQLVAVLPEGDPERHPFLFHEGGYVGLSAFLQNGLGVPDGNEVRLRNLEPGHYDLCLATLPEAYSFAVSGRPRERCTGGFLAPGGTLTLTGLLVEAR